MKMSILIIKQDANGFSAKNSTLLTLKSNKVQLDCEASPIRSWQDSNYEKPVEFSSPFLKELREKSYL